MMNETEAQKEAKREARRKAREAQGEREERQAAAHEAVYQRKVGRFTDWQSYADRLRAMVPKALDALEDILETGIDPKQKAAVALAVLRAAGLGALEAPHRPYESSPLGVDSTALLEGVSFPDLGSLGN
jgi:hypothetical protein